MILRNRLLLIEKIITVGRLHLNTLINMFSDRVWPFKSNLTLSNSQSPILNNDEVPILETKPTTVQQSDFYGVFFLVRIRFSLILLYNFVGWFAVHTADCLEHWTLISFSWQRMLLCSKSIHERRKWHGGCILVCFDRSCTVWIWDLGYPIVLWTGSIQRK